MSSEVLQQQQETQQLSPTLLFTQLEARVLALSAIFQAATLAQNLATQGRIRSNTDALETSLNSIIHLHAKDLNDIYGDQCHGLATGLNALIEIFSHIKKNTSTSHNIARYSFSLIHLQRKLMKEPEMIKAIQTGIQRIEKQLLHFPILHENIIASLANLYTNTLSSFDFRIYVTGEPLYLNQTAIINQIRALLLSGIRAAVLWEQLGGRRWQLIFSKAYIVHTAKKILARIT